MVHLWVIVIRVNVCVAVEITLCLGQYISSNIVLFQHFSESINPDIMYIENQYCLILS